MRIVPFEQHKPKVVSPGLREDTKDWVEWLVLGGILLLAALPRLTSLNAFLAHDETHYWAWSHDFFMALLQGNWTGTIVGPGNPSITIFLGHSLVMGLKYGWAWLNGVQVTTLATWPDFQLAPTLDLLIQRRMPLIIFNILAIVLAYRLLHRLYGRWVALVAAILLALDPFFLADSRTSRGEGLLASLALLAILAYLTYWLYGRRSYLFFSGLMTGLALLTKISAISLIGWAGLAALILLGYFKRQEFQGGDKQSSPLWASLLHFDFIKPLAAVWLSWIILAIATFWLLWPAMWIAPFQALGHVAAFVSDVGVSGRENFFFGQLYTDQLLPLYYPVVYILRVTPLAVLGLLAAFGYLGQTYFRRSKPDRQGQFFPALMEGHQPLLTVLLLLFALIYGLLMTVGTLKRDWYLLPIFPALDVVAAIGWVWLGQSWGRRWLSRVRPERAAVGAVAIMLLVQMATILPVHPYYYFYWNPLVLGDLWAGDSLQVGWDLDLSAGADYLNSKPNAAQLRVATRSTRGFTQIFKGQTIRWVPEQPWIQADYIILRRYHLQREKLEPYMADYLAHLKLDHVVKIEGVDYLWIYEGPRAQYFAGPSTLAGKATLLGYDLSQTQAAPGQTITAKFYWQNQGMTPADDFFLQLVDANQYVWAETTATPLPRFEQAAQTDKEIVESQADLTIPAGTPPGTYFLRAGVFDRARQETLGVFSLANEGSQVSVTKPPSILQVDLPITQRIEQEVAPQLFLLGFDLPQNTLFLSRPTWLSLYWQAGDHLEQDYVMAIQLLDQQGQEAAYWLGRPVFSGYPTSAWSAGELVRDPWQLELPAAVAPGEYTLQVTLFDAATEAQAGQTKLGPVTVLKRPQRFEIPALPNSVNVQLGKQVTLLGYDLSTEPLTGGGRLRLTLYWQAGQKLVASYTVFAHLLDAKGQVVAQHDGLPAEGAIPTPDWAVGEVIADRHLIEFGNLAPGDYRLIVGMYDPATGERLRVAGDENSVFLETLPIN